LVRLETETTTLALGKRVVCIVQYIAYNHSHMLDLSLPSPFRAHLHRDRTLLPRGLPSGIRGWSTPALTCSPNMSFLAGLSFQKIPEVWKNLS